MKKNTSSYLWQTIHTPPRVWNRPFSFLFFFCFEQIHTSDLLSLSLNKSSSFCMIKTLQKEHQDLNTSQHNLIYRTLCWKCENKDDKKIASSTIIIKLMCTMLKVQVIQCTLGINGVRFTPIMLSFSAIWLLSCSHSALDSCRSAAADPASCSSNCNFCNVSQHTLTLIY